MNSSLAYSKTIHYHFYTQHYLPPIKVYVYEATHKKEKFFFEEQKRKIFKFPSSFPRTFSGRGRITVMLLSQNIHILKFSILFCGYVCICKVIFYNNGVSVSWIWWSINEMMFLSTHKKGRKKKLLSYFVNVFLLILVKQKSLFTCVCICWFGCYWENFSTLSVSRCSMKSLNFIHMCPRRVRVADDSWTDIQNVSIIFFYFLLFYTRLSGRRW